jgi:hypothetical protein
MSLIIPANTLASGGFAVDNSCRFNIGSSDHLTRSLGGSPTSTRKATWSYWVKRSTLTSSASEIIYSNEVADDNNRGYIQFEDNDSFRMVDSVSSTQLKTNRLFRDVAAFYHIVLAIDTTQGTAANRIKLYVNGVQETSFATASYPSQNDDLKILTGGQTNKQHISKVHGGAGYFGGYLSEFVFIDGLQLAPTDFGEFDEDSGIWKPIDVSGLTFGTNGFYLDFEDSSALGNDVSGNNNDFTANNLTSIDQATDTCTNNFATMNPLIPGQTNYTYSDGNTTISQSSAAWVKSNSTIGMSSGKWYWEVKYVSGNYIVASVDNTDTATPYGPTSTSAVSYKRNGDLEVATVPQTALASYAHGDIVSVALDMDNSCVYFGKNGTWLNSGNPTSGASKTGAYSLPVANSTYFATFSIYDGSGGYSSLNFGNPAYAISSSNTDGDGYGNFEYAVPSGYYALNTKNLAEYG